MDDVILQFKTNFIWRKCNLAVFFDTNTTLDMSSVAYPELFLEEWWIYWTQEGNIVVALI